MMYLWKVLSGGSPTAYSAGINIIPDLARNLPRVYYNKMYRSLVMGVHKVTAPSQLLWSQQKKISAT